MRRIFVLFIVGILISAACGDSGPGIERETIDGVEYIHNRAGAWGETHPVTLEYVQTIGELDSQDENYQLFQPVDAARDSEGNIYVLEMGNARIQKFSPDGEFIRTIGRKGGGPGEIQQAIVMEIDRKNNLYVYDLGNFRIQIFSPDGEDLGSHRIQKPGANFRLRSDSTYALPLFVPGQSDADPKMVYLFDLDGNETASFGGEYVQDSDPMKQQMLNNIFLDIDAENNLYLTYALRDRIEKYGPDGTLLAVFDRPLNFGESSEPAMKQVAVMGMQMEIPVYNMCSSMIETDEKGRVWVLTPTKSMVDAVADIDTLTQESMQGLGKGWTVFHVFANDGTFLGEVEIDDPSGTIRIFGDRLYVVDSGQEMNVREFRIVESGK